MINILAGKDGRPSMKGVYSLMTGANQRLVVRRRLPGREFFRVYSNHDVSKKKKVRIPDMDLSGTMIRWGSRIPVADVGVVYNNATAIEKATDKKKARKLLLKAGVSCPKLVTRDNTTFPVIARPSRHAKGKNFVVLKNVTEFRAHWDANEHNGWYYSAFIDKDREIRVHCAHGKVLEIMEKPRPANGTIAWNRAINGAPFVRIERANYKKYMVLEALKAIKALGLDFGGVDVILVGNQAYVLEVNTSPTLNSSPHVTLRYSMYFDWLGRSETRRPHWDFTQFTAGTSLVWKNFQLTETNPTQTEE